MFFDALQVTAAEVRASDVERKLRDSQAATEAAEAETARVRAVLAAQEKECDSLQVRAACHF